MEEKNYPLNSKTKINHRLKRINQFNFIFRKGERFSTKNFALYVVSSKYRTYKIGFSISKKIGKAWKRNLLRRRIKEIIRLDNLPQPEHNYVLQARPGAGEVDYAEIERQLMSLFEKGKKVEN